MTYKPRSTRSPKFAVCIDNKGYPASLERGKIYRLVTDKSAASHGYLRVIDESGEDYAYASNRFFPMDLPRKLEQSLRSPATSV